MTVGIYSIKNKANDKIYIGQSVEIKKRKRAHFNYLKNNKHPNKYLQNSFNKYGKNNFDFEILTECKPEELDDLEVMYIKRFNSIDLKNGYNLREGGNKTTFSKETKEKMSQSWKKRFEDKEKTIQFFSDMNRTISLDVVAKIKKMLYEDIQVDEISEVTNVSADKINHIFNIQSFKHICPEYNTYLSIRGQTKRKKLIRDVMRMYVDNCTYQSIANKHGMHLRTAIRIVAANKEWFHEVQRDNVIAYRKMKLIRQVMTMNKFGKSKTYISRLLGISRSTVGEIMKENDRCDN